MNQLQQISPDALQAVANLAQMLTQAPTQTRKKLPPINRTVLENALRADMSKPGTISVVNDKGQLVGQKQIDRVASFQINEKEKSISVFTQFGAAFDMPLHVDVAQANRILNMDYSLNIEFDDAEQPKLSEMKMHDLRELAATKGLTLPTDKEKAIEVMKANGFSE